MTITTNTRSFASPGLGLRVSGRYGSDPRPTSRAFFTNSAERHSAGFWGEHLRRVVSVGGDARPRLYRYLKITIPACRYARQDFVQSLPSASFGCCRHAPKARRGRTAWRADRAARILPFAAKVAG